MSLIITPVNIVPYFLALTGNYTGSAGTALQKIFNIPGNGAFNASANTSYFFECEFSVTGMSGSSGSFSFGFLGTANITTIQYTAMSRKSASVVVTATAATASAITGNDTTTTGSAFIRGIIRITTAGTVIPAFGTSVSTTPTFLANSFFTIYPIGSDTVTTGGGFS